MRGKIIQQNKLRYKNIDGVNIYKLDELIKMKVIAFGGRDKIRDVYDLGFLLKIYPNKFSDEALFSIYEK